MPPLTADPDENKTTRARWQHSVSHQGRGLALWERLGYVVQADVHRAHVLIPIAVPETLAWVS
jgi:hypothetical protein